MTRPDPIVLPQTVETAVTYKEKGNFSFRYAYSRSADTQKVNEAGQDFLIILADKSRFAFALCDGVSQSFYGDLGSQLLGTNLAVWFWDLDASQSQEQIAAFLTENLNILVDEATSKVNSFVFPESVQPFVIPALEKKRAIGSESTFVAGVIDQKQQKACFAWMGDSRLRLWKGGKEIVAPFEGTFHTNERWSSKKGPVGELHLALLPLSAFDHMVTHSDGFANFDDRLKRIQGLSQLNANNLNDAIQSLGELPSSDDVSFLELWIGEKKPNFPVNIVANDKVALHYTEDKGKHSVSWKPLKGATSYEIKIRSQAGVIKSLEIAECFWQNETLLDSQAHSILVRGWWDNEPGPWSDAVIFHRPEAPKAFAPEPVPAPVGLPSSFPITEPKPLPSSPVKQGGEPIQQPDRDGPPSVSHPVLPQKKLSKKIATYLLGITSISCVACLYGMVALNIVTIGELSGLIGLGKSTTTPTCTQTIAISSTSTSSPSPTPSSTFSPTPFEPVTATKTATASTVAGTASQIVTLTASPSPSSNPTTVPNLTLSPSPTQIETTSSGTPEPPQP